MKFLYKLLLKQYLDIVKFQLDILIGYISGIKVVEYLSLNEINTAAEDIKHELNLLFSNKAVVIKPNSLQWQFFKDCFEKLLNADYLSRFDFFVNSDKAQLKYEVENKLRDFYLRPGRHIDFVFKMIHKKELKNIFDDVAYPDIGGYSVLVRDTSEELTPNSELTEKDIKDFIERVVTEAVETEFKAYTMLPQIIPVSIIEKWFVPDSPAFKEIMNLVLRHKERGWIITNHMNPSTKRILSMKIKKFEKGEVFVSTTEYWYLRWWNLNNNSNTYPYRETNRQQYILRKHNGNWKVYETIRTQPRTSIPYRRKYTN